jgi:hypothetical protein
VDIIERKDAYLVAVELPGGATGDLEIALQDGLLTIQGERHAAYDPAEEKIHGASAAWQGGQERRLTLRARRLTPPGLYGPQAANSLVVVTRRADPVGPSPGVLDQATQAGDPRDSGSGQCQRACDGAASYQYLPERAAVTARAGPASRRIRLVPRWDTPRRRRAGR